MSFKKIELDGLHPANPLHDVINDVNYNTDALISALDGLNGGSGVVGPQGPKGDAGAQGPAGIQGPQGEKGDKGDTGEPGPAGRDGVNGADGKDGAQGIQGVPGPQGLKGDKGDTGATGAKGETGAQGIQGLPGKDGKDGAQGPIGPQGPAGKDGSSSGVYLVSTNATGDEGGEIQLAKPPNGSLSGGVTIDAYQNKLRIFEQGGSARGVSIDLSKAPTGVGGELTWKVAGYVDAGQFITMDNFKYTVTTSGARGLSMATLSGNVVTMISGSFGYVNGAGGASTNGTWTATTTPSGSLFGWSFPDAGGGSTYLIQEVGTTARRFYRVTLQIGPGYSGNFISIERLY